MATTGYARVLEWHPYLITAAQDAIVREDWNGFCPNWRPGAEDPDCHHRYEARERLESLLGPRNPDLGFAAFHSPVPVDGIAGTA